MRWVGEADVVRAETDAKVRVGAILRVLESQVSRTAEDEEAQDSKEQIRKALEWVACGKERDQPRWIVIPGTEGENKGEENCGGNKTESLGGGRGARRGETGQLERVGEMKGPTDAVCRGGQGKGWAGRRIGRTGQ